MRAYQVKSQDLETIVKELKECEEYKDKEYVGCFDLLKDYMTYERYDVLIRMFNIIFRDMQEAGISSEDIIRIMNGKGGDVIWKTFMDKGVTDRGELNRGPKERLGFFFFKNKEKEFTHGSPNMED